LAFYMKAFVFANKYLGSEHTFTKLCNTNFLDAKAKIEKI